VKSLGDVRFDTGILLCGRVKRDLNEIAAQPRDLALLSSALAVPRNRDIVTLISAWFCNATTLLHKGGASACCQFPEIGSSIQAAAVRWMALCGGRDRFKPRISKHADCRDLTVAMLLSTPPASAAKASKVHRVARSVQQIESVHRSRARAACDVAAHETGGTTTCLDRAKDDTMGEAGGSAKGDRGAPTGMPGLPNASGFY
jgi:hypothetical protein